MRSEILSNQMVVREILAKSILSKSGVYDYVINPYVGCQHGCTYCYARFMKRFTGHGEPWGEFIDIKVNAPTLLQREITKKKPGRVWISGVCDPYQPIEKRYELTKNCLEILLSHDWPVTIQTKSTLLLRDIKLLIGHSKVEAGLSIATADEGIKNIFEPNTPAISERIKVLEELHRAGIRTYAMIAPLLANAEALVSMLNGKVDYVLIDRMNYHYADWVYRKYNLEETRNSDFFSRRGREISSAFEKQGIECQICFDYI